MAYTPSPPPVVPTSDHHSEQDKHVCNVNIPGKEHVKCRTKNLSVANNRRSAAVNLRKKEKKKLSCSIWRTLLKTVNHT